MPNPVWSEDVVIGAAALVSINSFNSSLKRPNGERFRAALHELNLGPREIDTLVIQRLNTVRFVRHRTHCQSRSRLAESDSRLVITSQCTHLVGAGFGALVL